MTHFDYDLIVIGGGAAGLVASKFAVSLGYKVAIIEKKKIGGDCTWTGCIPSKTILKVAQVAYHAKEFRKFGLKCPHNLEHEFDFDSTYVMDHVRSRVEKVYATHTPEILEKNGIKVLFGSPEFINNHTVQLGDQTVTSKKFIIATGSQTAIPPIDGINNVKYLTNETFFSLKNLPKSVIVLGAGPIGIELGSALVRLGVDTTIIEAAPNILPCDDEDITNILRESLEKEGLKIHTGLKAIKVTEEGNITTVHARDIHDNPFSFQAHKLLIASGRTARVQGLSLEKAGVMYSSQGIAVDKMLRTSASNIYACGDVVGPYRFSHMAEYQAVIATRNALFPILKKTVDYRQVIWVTFCDPELAVVGLNEREARKQYGNKITIIKVPYKDIDRTKTDLDDVGLAKYILDRRGRIIGATILGSRAGEIIHEVQVGKYYGVKLRKFYPVIHAYPTYSEIVWAGAKIAYVHKLKRNLFIRFIRFVFGYYNKNRT